MTYRGIYRDGVVVLQGDVEIPNGSVVEVNAKRTPAAKTKSAVARRARIAKQKPGSKLKPPLPGFGAWKHRTDIGNTADFARALRKRVSKRKARD